MRTAVILGAMVLAMAATVDAEARARGGRIGAGRSGGGASMVVVASSRPGEAAPKGMTAAQVAPVAPVPDPALVRRILPVRAPVQAVAPTGVPAVSRAASAGCGGGRLVGQGSGFCQLN